VSEKQLENNKQAIVSK